MTAQASDQVLHQGKRFALALFSDDGLFSPSKYGYNPVMASTACYRGYLSEYEIKNGSLFLKNFYISNRESFWPFSKKKKPPILNGIKAEESDMNFCGDWVFRNVHLPVKYTGGLILAREFIESLYIHIGFQSPWKYEEVIEILFDDGQVISENDLSSQIAYIRELITSETVGNGFNKADIYSLLRETFHHNYTK